MCVAGFEQGMEGLIDEDTISKNINASVRTIGANTSAASGAASGGFTQVINVNREISTPDEMARAVRLESRYGLMTGGALG